MTRDLETSDASLPAARGVAGSDAVTSETLIGSVDAASAETIRARVALATYRDAASSGRALRGRGLILASRVSTAGLVEATQALASAIDSLSQAHAEALVAMTGSLARLDERVSSLERGLESQAILGRARAAAQARHGAENKRARERVSGLSENDPDPARDPAHDPQPRDDEPFDDATYLEFERRFRGEPEDIRQRQRDALRFVQHLVGSAEPLLDLGAGRGEWLTVLRDAGIVAYGIDSSADMVASAVAADLDSRLGDALEHLTSLPEESLAGVSAFHLVEHVSIAMLRRLLDAALLALRPGGILMLETPNPTNLTVGAATFYLDPTHLRPLHPLLLHFLVESCGFHDVEIHYVHPVDADLATPSAVGGHSAPAHDRILDAVGQAIFGAQDYVVVARRADAAQALE